MFSTYRKPVYDYVRSEEQRSGRTCRHPVVVVGAGPVGLTAAIDLARRDIPVVLLDDDDTVSTGSRAICFAKRSLEIMDRLGCGQRLVDKGVTWNRGKVFLRDRSVYAFDLLPEDGHHRPAFINLQQYHFEEYLIDRLRELDPAAIRWRHKVIGVTPQADHVALRVETPDGVFDMECEYLIACDGCHSPIRDLLGLAFEGRVFQDRFLIADVVMKGDYPSERWFWFEPPFSDGQSALLHKQPDDVWRLDFQLGRDADPDQARKPENVIPRVRAMLGDDRPFELEWVSVYTFRCQRLERFRHGRVIFAGDSAHIVSPFGARGANGGIQDADNLVWKLALVLDGKAPESLLDSYDAERILAADENILNSTRSTDFITPKNAVSRAFRDAVLELAEDQPFARTLVNSGRLSVPAVLVDSPLNTPDEDAFDGPMVPGAPCTDAPVERDGEPGWLLDCLGDGFTLLCFGDGDTLKVSTRLATPSVSPPCQEGEPLSPTSVVLFDTRGLAARRYDARPGSCYLIRPDQHVAARWRAFDPHKVRAALTRATGAATP